MKKSCDGCKALEIDYFDNYSYFCGLNYKITKDYKPLEECPKPKTIIKYIELKTQNYKWEIKKF